jgi:arabinogalactan oligomer/maltooligosaccharide transport system substrate-binding protein
MRVRCAGAATVVTALALSITACGAEVTTTSATATGDGNLVIWADPDRTKALAPFADEFGAENGVTVEVKEISDNNQQTFVAASEQGSGPDVMIGPHDWIGNLVRNGAIAPVNLTAGQKAAFSKIAVKAVTFNGQMYGAPYAVESIALIRNTKLAPDAPASIEELVKTGRRLKAEGKVKEVLCLPVTQFGDAFHVYPIFASGGGAIFGTTASGDPDPRQVMVDSKGSVAAFGKLRELGETGDGALKSSLTNENTVPAFAAGKCAFLVSGPWAITDVRKSGLSYDITAIPGFEGGRPATPFVGVESFFVAAKSRNKALAQEFVTNYITHPDIAKAIYEVDHRPPALTAALDAVEGADPDAGKFMAAGRSGVPMPAIPEMSAIWAPFGIAENAVVKGGDPAQAAAAAQTAIDDSLQS